MAGRFKNNLRFALQKESLGLRGGIPINKIEKVGDILCWLIYEFKDFCVKIIFDPRFITIFLTAIAMTFAALLFYPSDTFDILITALISIIDFVNWGYVRFCLWILSEITIFGIGVRAFGRFTNQELLQHYQAQDAIS